MTTHDIPHEKWTIHLGDPEPSRSIHTPSVPPILEALSLLPLAYRLSSHIATERKQGREPIFDLNGVALQPPNPGPYGGVPCGGIGSGSIGRGYRGDFRRWSLHPGRYIHRVVEADVFSIRVKRSGLIYSQVLTTIPFNKNSCLSIWVDNPGKEPVSPAKVTYHALFPRAWTVYEEPVPGIRVTIMQISPFLPHSYSEASLPVVVFHVDVENIGLDDAEVSVMFTFQNGDGGNNDAFGGNVHVPFQTDGFTPLSSHLEELAQQKNKSPSEGSLKVQVIGVGQSHHHQTVVYEKDTPAPHLTPRSPPRSPTRQSQIDNHDENLKFSPIENPSFKTNDSASGKTTPWYCNLFKNSNSSSGPTKKFYRDQESFAIASMVRMQPFRASTSSVIEETENVYDAEDLTYCSQFISEVINSDTVFEEAILGKDNINILHSTESALELWTSFRTTGSIADCKHIYAPKISERGTKTASAVCLKKLLRPKQKKTFPFSLAWDCPLARFGSGKPLPRFHTRFFGTDGFSAPKIVSYALLYEADWISRIINWQSTLINNLSGLNETGMEDVPLDDKGIDTSVGIPSYYPHLLFNELYFLVDGGSIWANSVNGVPNSVDSIDFSSTKTEGSFSSAVSNFNQRSPGSSRLSETIHSATVLVTDEESISDKAQINLIRGFSDKRDMRQSPSGSPLRRDGIVSTISIDHLRQLHIIMLKHDIDAGTCAGDQRMVGQFLYLESHEYLMYNTYDVHFYASFALLMLFPQLELSLQRDFAFSVLQEDPRTRNLLYDGKSYPRKVKGCVPHDLGSPSEFPFERVNAYNFQDVSNWKDLGSKFVLQIYRDYQYIKYRDVSSDPLHQQQQSVAFLHEIYPAVLAVMRHTEKYDRDHDGMIENSGFPDQTYDIWIANGVQAYCGGLWIAACQATAAMARVMGDIPNKYHFDELVEKAKLVYMSSLWNGFYLNYDSSQSDHHDSIMADMLAGHWYGRLCNLPSTLTPDQVLSCLRIIYEYNVVKFGANRFIGAVNGMRPNGTVDKCCMQSREVWTGTTYGLAATMMHEAMFYEMADDYAVEINSGAGSNLNDELKYDGSAAPSPRSVDRESMHFSNLSQEKVAYTNVGITEISEEIDNPVLLLERQRTGSINIGSPVTDSTDPSKSRVNTVKSIILKNQSISQSKRDHAELIRELKQMAFNTAQGIHNGGWKEFGYWFATPEAWERNGNYRSLGYMRALAIWAIQYALEQKQVSSYSL